MKRLPDLISKMPVTPEFLNRGSRMRCLDSRLKRACTPTCPPKWQRRRKCGAPACRSTPVRRHVSARRRAGMTFVQRMVLLRWLLLVSWFTLVTSGIVLAQDSSGVTTAVLAKSGSSWDGTPLPAYPAEKPEITILRITIPSGAALPVHKHPVINAGVLVSGELTVITEDNKKKVLRAGDALVEVVNKWHYGKSTGKDPAVIVVFYAGSPETPITVRK